MTLSDLEIKKDWNRNAVVHLDDAFALLSPLVGPEAGLAAALIAQQTAPGSTVPVAAVKRMLAELGGV